MEKKAKILAQDMDESSQGMEKEAFLGAGAALWWTLYLTGTLSHSMRGQRKGVEAQGKLESDYFNRTRAATSDSVNAMLDRGVNPAVIKSIALDPVFAQGFSPLDDDTMKRFREAYHASIPSNSPDTQKPDWNVKDWITSDQGKGALGGGALGALLGRKSTLGMMLGTGGGAFLGGYLYPKLREYWTKKTETSV